MAIEIPEGWKVAYIITNEYGKYLNVYKNQSEENSIAIYDSVNDKFSILSKEDAETIFNKGIKRGK